MKEPTPLQSKSLSLPGEIRLKGDHRRLTIEIEGQIGLPEWWSADEDDRTATYENFRRQLDRIGASSARRIEVQIRSTGGNVNDALLIYETLCERAAAGAEITTCCSGYTASAATIVAQAASPGRRFVSPSTLYLIHNATTAWEGNSLDAAHTVRLLGETDARLAEIYATRSNRPVEQFQELMARNGGRGEWLSATEAIAAGLADRVSRNTPFSAVRNRVAERVKGWFRSSERNGATVTENGSARSAAVVSTAEPLPAATTAGNLRSRIRASATRSHEDPTMLLSGVLGQGLPTELSRNGQAYESDALRLRTSF